MPHPTISLCTFVKNENEALLNMLLHNYHYSDEVVIVDTNPNIQEHKAFAKNIQTSFLWEALPNPRIYNIGFTNFGAIRTATAHLASKEWVLMLDADESLGPTSKNSISNIINDFRDFQAFGIPRKRWADLNRKNQLELEAYPDYQVRLFKNNKAFSFKRELHEYFDGTAVCNLSPSRDLQIDHFHDVFKTPKQLAERQQLYKLLSQEAKVTVEGGKPIVEKEQLTLFDI